MAAGSGAGLVGDQVVQLRARVAAGARPRVRVTGAQFPAGTTGTVARVGEPDIDGEDFVTVRVKIGGVVDELRFSPGELSMAGRTRTTAPSAQPPAETASARSPRVG